MISGYQLKAVIFDKHGTPSGDVIDSIPDAPYPQFKKSLAGMPWGWSLYFRDADGLANLVGDYTCANYALEIYRQLSGVVVSPDILRMNNELPAGKNLAG